MAGQRIIQTGNLLYYAFKRNNWILDPRRYFSDFDSVKIYKPVFLIGTQGGGLTLASRMFRRNKQMVSVTGNHRYWAGADEMQLVLEKILPEKLTGIGKVKVPSDKVFNNPRGWVYATDRLLGYYRCRAKDADLQTARDFQRILRWIIARHGLSPRSRFIDKSQLYTVKVSFINQLLEGADPKFLLIVRDPFVSCYRAAKKNLMMPELSSQFNFDQMLDFASQHWSNSIQAALDDGQLMDNFRTIRFEDLLQNPGYILQEMCDFTELEFSPDMLPQAGDQIPLGSLRRDRWYPLRRDVNQRYFEQMKPEHAAIIADRCGELATNFEYKFPFS